MKSVALLVVLPAVLLACAEPEEQGPEIDLVVASDSTLVYVDRELACLDRAAITPFLEVGDCHTVSDVHEECPAACTPVVQRTAANVSASGCGSDRMLPLPAALPEGPAVMAREVEYNTMPALLDLVWSGTEGAESYIVTVGQSVWQHRCRVVGTSTRFSAPYPLWRDRGFDVTVRPLVLAAQSELTRLWVGEPGQTFVEPACMLDENGDCL